MNKLNTKPQPTSFSISTASQSDTGHARRLIVLAPTNAGYTAATQRVWELVVATNMRVLFLGLCKDATEEPSLRRQLVMMSALVQDGKVSTEVKVEIGTNWIDVVKRNYQTGDVIVCFAEQRVGLMHRPLSQILETQLNITVYILSGLYTQEYAGLDWVSQAFGWAGFISIIAGSFLLQSQIMVLRNDWTQTTLLIFSVVFEFWLIWVWNNLFS